MKGRSRGFCDECGELTRHIKDDEWWRCMDCNTQNYAVPEDYEV